jgi:zinc finger protein
MDSNKDLGEQPTEMKSDTTEQIQDIAQDVKQTDDDWNGVDEMESLCMSCGASGITRMKMHKIPNFRELLIASFTCDECGEFNNEVTFGGTRDTSFRQSY